MDTITAIGRTGSALSCVPATVLPASVAVPSARLRRRWAEPLLVAAVAPRTGGDVSPAISDPIFDEHKCTGASVPGRRGGT